MTDLTIYDRTGASRILPATRAENEVRNSRGNWSFAKPLPVGWDREIPRYRAQIDLRPSPFARHRAEKPFSSVGEVDIWQYADKPVPAGAELETTAWPHGSLLPLNESAKRTLEFFKSTQKSRLPLRPWRGGRLYLDDGLSGVAGFTPPPLSKLPTVQSTASGR